MFQTQYSTLALEELECQESDLPLLALTSGPYDDDGSTDDDRTDDFEVKAEAPQD
ncbi:MAG: hypothetical protein ACRDIV_00200 [Ktedonobacteraceae bacterium]